MKNLLFIIYIISFSFSFSQDKSSIKVKLEGCKEHLFLFQPKIYFELYKGNNLMKSVSSNSRHRNIIKNLDTGNYKLVYWNKSKKEVIEKIIIDEVKQYEILICGEKVSKDKSLRKSFIKQLQNNEFFILNFYSQGCFHSNGNRLVFSKQSDKYFVSYEEKIIELSNNQVNQISNFEKKINKFNKIGMCTTTDYYELIYKNKIVKIEDDTCSWDGFDDLIEVLNIKLTD
jgi:hypothetical protein